MIAQTFVFKSYGGIDLAADVYVSSVRPSGVILSLHGGGMIAGTRKDIAGDDGWGLLRELLNHAGYTIVSPDYRLAPESKLADIVEDLTDVWNWIQTTLPNHCDVDVTRLGVMGRSAGGYLSLLLGTLMQPRPRALVSFYGYSSLLDDWVNQPSDHYRQQAPVTEDEARSFVSDYPVVASGPEHPRMPIYLHARQTGHWMEMVTGLDFDKDTQALMALSPNLNIDPAFPSALLLHGTADTDVPYEASVSAEAALRTAGRNVQLVTLEGADHLFDRAVTRAAVEAAQPLPEAASLRRVVSFFSEEIG
jgi:acetyl esterase/lipase